MKSNYRQLVFSAVLIAGLACAALFVAAGSRASQVTFTKDIAPILFKSCAECHRPGEIAPMSLMSYQEVRPWAKSIRERVVEGSMPPWSADPKYGHWANDPRLSKKEIDTIIEWVNAGAPKGEDKDLPAAPKFATGWTIGEPDVVIQMPEEYTVPADGTVPYLYFSMPTNFTEDKWISAMEIRPGNRSVVHHVIAYAQDANVKDTAPGGEGDLRRGRVHLGGITPNKTGVTFGKDSARLIKKGSNIVFQMHYTTNGQVTKDRTKIAFVFSKEPGKKELVTGNAINTNFVIPAGAARHEVKASKTMSEDVLITSFMPHTHVRGAAFTYTAVYPDGRSEILLNVPQYDFNWQHTYLPKEPIALPKGTRLDCVAYFDNSPKNKFNPDPTKAVRWGDQTWEEMMIGWYTFTRANAVPKTTASSSGQ
ncbi:MAG TPA: thiol-disulfide isomerase [Blastocatellia bacterium]|nr:thiol-disulfide isomerase [Blastocatellia bacterium]HMV84195.1 thiol-disulfide isomerase [Blastocatellia bacterium]HMZ18244.1 thiol-disulfide isomerase [Blastocatellia bacterium]HNG33098.1 thiol-disulfide isomerase [Blastocatellia bacterium]